MGTIRSFEDLEVWKLGRQIRKKLYEVARRLPEHEKYTLAPQIRNAALSLTANLAEGYGRFHFKENVQFGRISRGSAFELLDHLITCNDEGYINNGELQETRDELSSFLRLLNGYIRSIGKAADAGKRQ
ncbi:MAG: four helix bundle protein [Nitrospiraceae bacterium]